MLFHRSEIDHLTALMRSRTVNAPVKEEVKGTEMVPSEPMLLSGIKEYPKTPALENGTKNGLVVTPHASSVQELAFIVILYILFELLFFVLYLTCIAL